MKDKSMINMAGTSMGSYDKPMMKGSGLEMKCGCQLGKHMGGPKMMGFPEIKNPAVTIDVTKQKTPQELKDGGIITTMSKHIANKKPSIKNPSIVGTKTKGVEKAQQQELGKLKGFRESFAENRKAGKKEFKYEGKMYSTKTAEDVAKGLNDKDLYKAYERAEAILNSFENVPGSSKLKSREEQFNSYLNEGLKRESKMGGAKMMGKKSCGK